MNAHRVEKAISSLVAFFVVSISAFPQLPPASEVVPPGFKVTMERDLGGSKIITATKSNDNLPKPHMDLGITLEVSWQNIPAADMVLEMAANQPEDPAGQIPGSATREEPCGNIRYRGGVLRCRKVITPWIGAGQGPDLETWRIGWTGKGPAGGLVGVSFNFFYGSKESLMAWIDAIIPKITKAE